MCVLFILIIKVEFIVVCFERLQKDGYPGSLTTIKRYISAHKYLLPARPGAISQERLNDAVKHVVALKLANNKSLF